MIGPGGPQSRKGPLRVMIGGAGSAAAMTLRKVEGAGHRVVGVYGEETGNGPFRGALAEAARSRGIPCRGFDELREGSGFPEDRDGEILLAVGLPVIAADAVIGAFPLGAYNLHTGPLPQYAGLNTVSWAICRGEKKHGVTLHRMTSRVDGGPIAYQATFPIGENDSAITVLGRCVREGYILVEKLLAAATHRPRGLPQLKQDLSLRTYYGAGPPGDGRINWEGSASAIFNLVRACDYGPFEGPWGRPWTVCRGSRVDILSVDRTGETAALPPGSSGRSETAGVPVACGDEWLLVRRVGVAGAERDPAAVFTPGSRLASVRPVV